MEETPPSFELDPPTLSEEDERMRGRLAARMFGETEPQPQCIAHYELERRIGAGGMGVVHLAHDRRLERSVALKLLRRDRARERDRLLSEARTLARLSHPHVVQVYEIGEYEGGVFIAMEFIEGRDLLRWQRVEQPGLAELLDAYCQAGLGLAAAHALGIVHLDFKASNLLRGDDGRVRVADFGLAEQLVEFETEPSKRRIMGTPGYMAPEIVRGEPADARADQFSFCAALWEARTGHLPFAPGVGARAGTRASSRLSPRWLERVLLRGLADDPAARWSGMDDLVTRIQAQPTRRKHWSLIGAVVLATGLAIGFVHGLSSTICEGGRLDTVWTSQRRAELLALADSPTTRNLVAQVDRFATRWQATHEHACQAPSELRTRIDACLDRQARRLDHTLATFERDFELAEVHFDELLEQIGDPRLCANDDRVEPPTELAIEVASLRAQIDSTRIDLAAGRVGAAEGQARALVATTKNHAFPPVEAEARDLYGLVLASQGRPGAAIDQHRAAARLAETIGDLPLLFIARVHAAQAAAIGGQSGLAREWLIDARTSMAMLGNPAELEVELLFAESHWRASPGEDQDFNAAIASMHRAFELVDPADESRRGRLHQRLANVLAEAKRNDLALTIYGQLADSYRERLGADAHVLGVTYYNMALSEREVERFHEAREHLEQAITIQQGTLGEHSPQLGEIRLALASVALELVQPDLAWAHLEQTRRLQSTPELAPQWALVSAMTLTELGRHDEALRLYESPMLRNDETEAVIINRAWLRCRVAACRGIEGFDPEHERLAGPFADHARLILANRELAEKQPARAWVWLATLLEPIEAKPSVSDEFEAEAAWLAAWALKSDQPARARALAEKALDHYRTLARPQQIAALVELLEDS